MSDPLKPWFPVCTERLLLREFREGDFDDVHAYACDPEVARFMDWGPNAHEQTVGFLARKLEEQNRWPRDEVTLAIEHLADARLIGSIRLAVSDRAQSDGRFRLHPEQRPLAPGLCHRGGAGGDRSRFSRRCACTESGRSATWKTSAPGA